MNPYLQLALIVTALKLLLIYSYRSTDFEVHRNWLAITHSLPISKWYYEDTSIWTLDYPPLFAWFEWLLSQFAQYVDPQMLVVSNLDYASISTVVFQRLTVIVSDVVLITAAYKLATVQPGKQRGGAVYLLLVTNAGLLLVDHIHFQYNGVLLGVLLWSLYYAHQGRDLAAGAVFAVLLNMKHLFAYAGPVYFVYMLRHYCVGRGAVLRFTLMGLVVGVVCALSFGPFIAMGQLEQVLSRLFPFGRGLCHAYWAANFWALYSAGDKVLSSALPRLLGVVVEKQQANMAGGVVGISRFLVLPQVAPSTTVLLVLLALLPCLLSLSRRPTPQRFAAAVTYSYLSGFMFGYHVHEKAALMALVPMALCAVSPGPKSTQHAADFLLLAASSVYGLFPLLFESREYLIKVVLGAAYMFIAWQALAKVHGISPSSSQASGTSSGGTGSKRRSLMTAYEKLYVLGFIPLELYCSFVHPVLLGQMLPFVPLMLTSVYCALGVSTVWLRMAWAYVRGDPTKGDY